MTERDELEITAVLRRAGLTALQVECVLYRVEGMTGPQIALKLHQQRRVVRLALAQAQAKIGPLLEAAEAAAWRFPKELLYCVAERKTDDERPEGVSGVTPSRSSDRFHGGVIVDAEDPRLEQDLRSALKLGEWALQAR